MASWFSEGASLVREILWGVPLWRFLAATLIIFIGFLSRRVITFVFGSILKRYADKTRMRWDDDALELLPPPLAIVTQILLWYVAAVLLGLPTEPINIRSFVFQGLQVALAVGITWFAFRLADVLSRSLSRIAAKTDTRLDDQVIPLLRKTIKVVLAITVSVMVIQNLGYSVTSLLASLGVGGLALALAAKDTVANFFGSVIVFTDRPFQVGDWIEFADIEGTVEEVGFRTTRVRRFDKSLVTVPNQTFSTAAITNHTRRPIRRIKLTVGVTYETSAEQMRKFLSTLRGLVANHPDIDQNFHFVHFTEFGDSSLNLQVYCFTKSTIWKEWLAAREDLMLQIMDAVEEHGLEIAFPTRTVYLRDEQWPERALEEAAGKGV
jgi:MscS family membrane protein